MNVPFETQIILSRLINLTSVGPLLFVKCKIIYSHIPHKLLGITKVMVDVWDRSGGAETPPGHTYEIKSVSRIHRVTNNIAVPMTDHGIAGHYRVAVMHYLLDMG